MDDRSRRLLSSYFDGQASEEERVAVEQMLETSSQARRYLESLSLLRRNLRYAPAESPDVTGRVLARISADRRKAQSRRTRWAAAFAAGAVAGAVFIGVTFDQPAPVASADIPSRVLQAQTEVESLNADVRITERGLHPSLGERVFEGRIAYRSPETLWVEITDLTDYPSSLWVPNHVTSVVAESTAWFTGVAACPTEALPSCTPREPRAMATAGREPFPDISPAPLDLVVPVNSFHLDFEPRFIGYRSIDGRQAIGLRVTAAQVEPVIEGLTSVGNWREIHPADRVDLWLDVDHLVPLAMTVRPDDSADRRLWAIRNSYSDSTEIPILEVEWSNVLVNGPTVNGLPTMPPGIAVTSAGFEDLAGLSADLLRGIRLPEGMDAHRSGVVSTPDGPKVWVTSWTNGRAWLKISWTSEWSGSRLFGDLGDLVKVESIETGPVYIDEKGQRIAIHSQDLDVAVVGSLPTAVLLDIASTLDVRGELVPDDWQEAATGTIREAVAELTNLLVPVGLADFSDPAIRVEEDIVVLSYAGPGNRGFVLTEAVDGVLSPPLEADVRGVGVREIVGRYSPGRGQLEWIEDGISISLASATLSLEELLAIAATMASP